MAERKDGDKGPARTSALDTKEQRADALRALNIRMQADAYNRGIELNRIMKAINREAEPVIVGQCHRAAGLLIYHAEHVLLCRTDKGLELPGGKAQGDEYPLQTAVREAGEETLHCVSEDRLDALFSEVVPQINVVSGKYTLFFLPYPELEDVPKLYKQALPHYKGKAKIPTSLEVCHIDKLEGLTSFAKEVLGLKALREYLKRP